MKTTETFIQEMESSGILMSRECTFNEYVSELLQFQDMICKMIAGDEYYEGMRIDEALFIMESTARKRGIRSNLAVHNGILTMKRLAKEMAITMSGAKGEKLVSRTLEFCKRPNIKIYQNVYVSDGEHESELDAIVLTENGIIILEIKKVKADFTLTENGRMVFAGDECYEKVPLGQKMVMKRKLLKSCMEEALNEKGCDIPVCVDSFIVFSAPKGQHINIDDRYRKEKHCFRTCLNRKLESYLGYAYYKPEQLDQLDAVLSSMESNVKRFETDLNFDEVRRSLAEALAAMQEPSAKSEIYAVAEEQPKKNIRTTKIVTFNQNLINAIRKPAAPKAARYAAASAITGVIITGAALMLTAASRQV